MNSESNAENAPAKRYWGRPFKPGNPGKAPGTVNKINRTVKSFVLEVFNKLQESDNPASLENWAIKEPTEFYRIAAKLIPTDIKAEVTQVREIQLKVRRGEPTVTDIEHEIVKNDQIVNDDQGSGVEPAEVSPGSGAGVPRAQEIQCSQLWSQVREDDTGS